MEILIKASQFILSLSLLIVLHEFGHYLPAKAFKTRVEKFFLFFRTVFVNRRGNSLLPCGNNELNIACNTQMIYLQLSFYSPLSGDINSGGYRIDGVLDNEEETAYYLVEIFLLPGFREQFDLIHKPLELLSETNLYLMWFHP